MGHPTGRYASSAATLASFAAVASPPPKASSPASTATATATATAAAATSVTAWGSAHGANARNGSISGSGSHHAASTATGGARASTALGRNGASRLGSHLGVASMNLRRTVSGSTFSTTHTPAAAGAHTNHSTSMPTSNSHPPASMAASSHGASAANASAPSVSSASADTTATTAASSSAASTRPPPRSGMLVGGAFQFANAGTLPKSLAKAPQAASAANSATSSPSLASSTTAAGSHPAQSALVSGTASSKSGTSRGAANHHHPPSALLTPTTPPPPPSPPLQVNHGARSWPTSDATALTSRSADALSPSSHPPHPPATGHRPAAKAAASAGASHHYAANPPGARGKAGNARRHNDHAASQPAVSPTMAAPSSGTATAAYNETASESVSHHVHHSRAHHGMTTPPPGWAMGMSSGATTTTPATTTAAAASTPTTSSATTSSTGAPTSHTHPHHPLPAMPATSVWAHATRNAKLTQAFPSAKARRAQAAAEEDAAAAQLKALLPKTLLAPNGHIETLDASASPMKKPGGRLTAPSRGTAGGAASAATGSTVLGPGSGAVASLGGPTLTSRLVPLVPAPAASAAVAVPAVSSAASHAPVSPVILDDASAAAAPTPPASALATTTPPAASSTAPTAPTSATRATVAPSSGLGKARAAPGLTGLKRSLPVGSVRGIVRREADPSTPPAHETRPGGSAAPTTGGASSSYGAVTTFVPATVGGQSPSPSPAPSPGAAPPLTSKWSSVLTGDAASRTTRRSQPPPAAPIILGSARSMVSRVSLSHAATVTKDAAALKSATAKELGAAMKQSADARKTTATSPNPWTAAPTSASSTPASSPAVAAAPLAGAGATAAAAPFGVPLERSRSYDASTTPAVTTPPALTTLTAAVKTALSSRAADNGPTSAATTLPTPLPSAPPTAGSKPDATKPTTAKAGTSSRGASKISNVWHTGSMRSGALGASPSTSAVASAGAAATVTLPVQPRRSVSSDLGVRGKSDHGYASSSAHSGPHFAGPHCAAPASSVGRAASISGPLLSSETPLSSKSIETPGFSLPSKPAGSASVGATAASVAPSVTAAHGSEGSMSSQTATPSPNTAASAFASASATAPSSTTSSKKSKAFSLHSRHYASHRDSHGQGQGHVHGAGTPRDEGSEASGPPSARASFSSSPLASPILHRHGLRTAAAPSSTASATPLTHALGSPFAASSRSAVSSSAISSPSGPDGAADDAVSDLLPPPAATASLSAGAATMSLASASPTGATAATPVAAPSSLMTSAPSSAAAWPSFLFGGAPSTGHAHASGNPSREGSRPTSPRTRSLGEMVPTSFARELFSSVAPPLAPSPSPPSGGLHPTGAAAAAAGAADAAATVAAAASATGTGMATSVTATGPIGSKRLMTPGVSGAGGLGSPRSGMSGGLGLVGASALFGSLPSPTASHPGPVSATLNTTTILGSAGLGGLRVASNMAPGYRPTASSSSTSVASLAGGNSGTGPGIGGLATVSSPLISAPSALSTASIRSRPTSPMTAPGVEMMPLSAHDPAHHANARHFPAPATPSATFDADAAPFMPGLAWAAHRASLPATSSGSTSAASVSAASTTARGLAKHQRFSTTNSDLSHGVPARLATPHELFHQHQPLHASPHASHAAEEDDDDFEITEEEKTAFWNGFAGPEEDFDATAPPASAHGRGHVRRESPLDQQQQQQQRQQQQPSLAAAQLSSAQRLDGPMSHHHRHHSADTLASSGVNPPSGALHGHDGLGLSGPRSAMIPGMGPPPPPPHAAPYTAPGDGTNGAVAQPPHQPAPPPLQGPAGPAGMPHPHPHHAMGLNGLEPHEYAPMHHPSASASHPQAHLSPAAGHHANGHPNGHRTPLGGHDGSSGMSGGFRDMGPPAPSHHVDAPSSAGVGGGPAALVMNHMMAHPYLGAMGPSPSGPMGMMTMTEPPPCTSPLLATSQQQQQQQQQHPMYGVVTAAGAGNGGLRMMGTMPAVSRSGAHLAPVNVHALRAGPFAPGIYGPRSPGGGVGMGSSMEDDPSMALHLNPVTGMHFPPSGFGYALPTGNGFAMTMPHHAARLSRYGNGSNTNTNGAPGNAHVPTHGLVHPQGGHGNGMPSPHYANPASTGMTPSSTPASVAGLEE
ncbi:hypothetical protein CAUPRSCDRAFT_10769, partial [Caulochytrium protostelioides]